MKPRSFTVLVLMLIAAVVTWKLSRPENEASQVSQTAASKDRGESSTNGSENVSPGGQSAATSPRDDAPKAGKSRPNGPAVTRSSLRETVVSQDGVRRTVVDPMASWQDLPPWPEGPRLFAEVDTGSRRYVNLRPDDVGELPRIRAEAEERIELRVNFPEGEPGEKIHVELPNGGAFADSDAKGRVFTLPENRTLSFPYITDDSRGHCNVKLRHRGHTRSLPIWIGKLPETDF